MNTEQETVRAISAYRYRKTPNLETAISYVVSINKETNRQSDEYFFWIDKDGLTDTDTGDYLHNLISPDSHHNPYLGLTEYSILWQLDAWSLKNAKNNGKLSVWFSPELKSQNEYDGNKIVIHEISEAPSGQKKLNNIMIIFDCDRNTCLQIAKQLFPHQTNEINTPEELRAQLIDAGENLTITDIIKVISPYIPKNEKYMPMRREDLVYLGELISQGASPYFFAEEMLRLGGIGEFSLVCAGGGNSYSELLGSKSLTLNFGEAGGKYVKNCGQCGKPINAVIAAGYRCSCGGVYMGC